MKRLLLAVLIAMALFVQGCAGYYPAYGYRGYGGYGYGAAYGYRPYGGYVYRGPVYGGYRGYYGYGGGHGWYGGGGHGWRGGGWGGGYRRW